MVKIIISKEALIKIISKKIGLNESQIEIKKDGSLVILLENNDLKTWLNE